MAGYTRQQLIAAKAGVVGVTSFAAGWYLGREEGDYAASILVAGVIFGAAATTYEVVSSWLAGWFAGAPGPDETLDDVEEPHARTFRLRDAVKVLATFLVAQLLVWVIAVLSVAMPDLVRGSMPEATATLLQVFPIGLPLSMIVSAFAVFLLAKRLTRRINPADPRGAFALLPADRRSLLFAAAAGALMATLLGLLSAVVPSPNVDDQGLLARALDSSAAARIVFGLTAVLLAPPVEEYVFRGVLLGTLLPAAGVTGAAALSGTAFWLLHLSEWRHYWPAALGVGAMTLLVTALRLRSGSILPAICAHMSYNGVLTLLAMLA